MKPSTVVTTIRLPVGVWKKLRELAEARSLTRGGQPSANAVVAELVEEAAARGRGRRRA